MGAFISLSESPFHGSLGRSRYPGEWDDQQVMSPTRVRFTPASGALSGVDTWFYYYRGLNNLISAGGISQIGVKTAAVATFDGFNWNDQRAVNPVIENDFPGAPSPVAGGLYNDMRAVVYAGKIRLFVAIYGNPSGSNRTAIFESADGFTFTYVDEAEKDAAYLGRTIGAIANVGGTLVSLVSIANGAGGGNGRQKWVSTDGGLTWLERGLAIPVGIEGDWNGLTYLGGTMELIGDYYVALLHGMPFIGYRSGVTPHLDWPEAFGAFRIHVDDILTADVIWEANAQNPLFIAGPTHGATWHAALYQHNGSTFAHMETWGVPGFENIGNATNMALRDTPYFGVESRVSSAQIYMLEMKDRGWLDNWTTPILADGGYTLRHVGSGKFVGIVSGAPVPVIDDEGEIAKFTIDRQLSYYRFRNGGVSMRATSEFAGSAMVMEPSPGVLTNQAGQWDLTPWGDPVSGGGRHVVITNRYTRMALALTNGTEADGSPLVCLPFTGDPAQVFEIMPYRPSSTTTEFPDPENPMLNMTLPAGDLVGTTEPQNLANKTLALAGHTGTIAQLITAAAAGDFDDLADNSVVWAGGYPFVKQAGAAYTGLPVGFIPAGPILPGHFGAAGDGVTDDYAALTALSAWLKAISPSTVLVDGMGGTFATSAPFILDRVKGAQFIAGTIKAIGSAASWANTYSDVTDYFADIQTVTADGKTWVERNPTVIFESGYVQWEWNVDGGGVAAGIRALNTYGSSELTIVRDVTISEFKTYGVLSIREKGKIQLDNAFVKQVSAGGAYIAGRDGYGIVYAGIDTEMNNSTSCFSHCPLLTTGGTLFLKGCDIFNGAGSSDFTEISGTAPTFADLPPSAMFPDAPENGNVWYVTADNLHYEYTAEAGWTVTAITEPTSDVRLWEHRSNKTINWSAGRLGNGQIHNWAAGGGLTINGAKVGYTGTNSSSVWMKCYAVQPNQKLGKLSIRNVQFPKDLVDGSVPFFELTTDAAYPTGAWSLAISIPTIESMTGAIDVVPDYLKFVSMGSSDTVMSVATASSGANIQFSDKDTTGENYVGVVGDVMSMRATDASMMESGSGAYGARLNASGNFRPYGSNSASMTIGTAAVPWRHVYAKDLRLIPTTVSELPSAATAGSGTLAFVSDALAPTFGAAVTGGGSTACPAYSDGTIWRVG